MGQKGFSGMLSIELEGGLQSGIKFVEVQSGCDILLTGFIFSHVWKYISLVVK